MKINKMKTKQLTGILAKLATVRLTSRDAEGSISLIGKGDETQSLYGKHIQEELNRRES